jgi:hypothetical protein
MYVSPADSRHCCGCKHTAAAANSASLSPARITPPEPLPALPLQHNTQPAAAAAADACTACSTSSVCPQLAATHACLLAAAAAALGAAPAAGMLLQLLLALLLRRHHRRWARGPQQPQSQWRPQSRWQPRNLEQHNTQHTPK